MSDPANCGACGRQCGPVIHGRGLCGRGSCAICEGNPGYADCDDDCVTNGLETSVSNDPANCGRCGNVCKAFPNALPTCTNSKCTGICAPGFGDCDGLVPNGCEQDLSADPKNCGACGKVCGPLVCVNGKCQ